MHWESVLEKYRLAYRQKSAFYQAKQLLSEFPWKLMLSTFLLVCELFGCVFSDTPYTPHGQALDLRDYTLVLSDEFRGDTLDTTVWKARERTGGRGNYAPGQLSVHDDCLYLTGEYRQDGEFGAGWYSGALSLIEKYTNGYYEIRCKCNKGVGFWSAFWLLTENAYDHYASKGGVFGAEIDIMEAMGAEKRSARARSSVTHTIHCNGWDADPTHIDSRILGNYYVKDIYDTFHTYGLAWTESEYIFYIDGVESARSSFGNGVCTVPAEVIVSLELPHEEKLPLLSQNHTTQMTVDYIRIYQKTVFA